MAILERKNPQELQDKMSENDIWVEEKTYRCIVCPRKYSEEEAQSCDFQCSCDPLGEIREYCTSCDSFIEEQNNNDRSYKWIIELEATKHEVETHFDVMHGGASLPYTIRRKYQRRK